MSTLSENWGHRKRWLTRTEAVKPITNKSRGRKARAAAPDTTGAHSYLTAGWAAPMAVKNLKLKAQYLNDIANCLDILSSIVRLDARGCCLIIG